MRIVVVGAGVFGLPAALALRRRGHAVTVVDPGPVPHPDAASNDISKIVRLDYGQDAFFTELAELVLPEWRVWNDRFGERVFEETGVLFLTHTDPEPGGFEFESMRVLEERGHRFERLDRAEIARRFPAWTAARYAFAYRNPVGGWVRSGRVIALLAAAARDAGCAFLRATTTEVHETGITTDRGGLSADCVVVAAGAWTPALLPWLGDRLWAVGQPVLHFQATDLGSWQPPAFLPWTSDIAKTGWYGFPAQPDGIVKIAHHGVGVRIDANEPRDVPATEEARFREFLRGHLPGLSDAPLVATRLCLYCDSWDGSFWIDRDPERDNLVVATGGSGHGMKFAPVLGEIIADVVEHRDHPHAHRFRWRERGAVHTEDARHD